MTILATRWMTQSSCILIEAMSCQLLSTLPLKISLCRSMGIFSLAYILCFTDSTCSLGLTRSSAAVPSIVSTLMRRLPHEDCEPPSSCSSIDVSIRAPSLLKYHLMGRMQCKGKGKGISGSCTPYLRKSPKWVSNSPSAVCELIVKLAKKGESPSQIGKTLRDQHAIPQVKLLTGQKILRILKKNGCAPEIPEDLYCLIKKAVNIRKHLEKFRKDKDAKYRLILIESRIHRLSRYYKRTQKIPAKFKYNIATATALISS